MYNPGNRKVCRNKNAIFFGISDNYVFAVANILMGFYRYSTQMISNSDVIIFHDGISNSNKDMLMAIHRDTCFVELCFPEMWDDILKHKKTLKWGKYVICKLFGFQLIHHYEKALFLDADMLVVGDVSYLFEIKEEMAWRKIISWDPVLNFSSLTSKDVSDRNISVGNGGMILFSNKLEKYNINDKDILDAFEAIKKLRRGGIDEDILAWIVYKNNIELKEIDVSNFNTPAVDTKDTSNLVHFLDYKSVQTKPWKNLASYLYFDEWRENYQTWLDMGGEGPINWTKEDYYGLFAFDKARKIEKLTKENKQLKEELKQTKEAFETEKVKLKSFKEKLSAIKNSKSWRITKPLRYIMKLLKKIKP